MLSCQAYLLERLGDVQAALGIFCGAAERANAALVVRVLDGSIPANSLPAPAQGRTGRAGFSHNHSSIEGLNFLNGKDG